MAPFIMGIVVKTRITEERRCQETMVHWFTPAKRGMREEAASQSVERYGGDAFIADYLQTGPSDGRIRRVPNTGWEKLLML